MSAEALSATIKERALWLGASLVGIAGSRSVLQTPSHRDDRNVRQRFKSGVFIVMALAHPASHPELDWWDGRGGTPGNRELQRISGALQNWLKKEYQVPSRILPYQKEKGGIFLKEAAVMAGLGIIGRSNLLITRQYGAGVRLRALFLEKDIQADRLSRFAPCEDCPAPCMAACPQHAFENGTYDRKLCNLQMLKNEENRGVNGQKGMPGTSAVAYCRACEQACRVSRSSLKS